MISNNIIQQTKCITLLVLHIDDKFNWQEHTNACKNKQTSALYIVNKVNHYLPVAALKTIYYTLVYLYLTYGIILRGSKEVNSCN